MESILKYLAQLFYSLANNNANTTCMGPAFQMKEPVSLDLLKKNK